MVFILMTEGDIKLHSCWHSNSSQYPSQLTLHSQCIITSKVRLHQAQLTVQSVD